MRYKNEMYLLIIISRNCPTEPKKKKKNSAASTANIKHFLCRKCSDRPRILLQMPLSNANRQREKKNPVAFIRKRQKKTRKNANLFLVVVWFLVNADEVDISSWGCTANRAHPPSHLLHIVIRNHQKYSVRICCCYFCRGNSGANPFNFYRTEYKKKYIKNESHIRRRKKTLALYCGCWKPMDHHRRREREGAASILLKTKHIEEFSISQSLLVIKNVCEPNLYTRTPPPPPLLSI